MIAAALLLLAALDGDDGDDLETRARLSEEAAFAAVDDKRWCEALALFLDADSKVASPDLIFNAAQAAELGADRARAMQLYTQLLGTTTSEQRKGEAKRRIAELTKVVERDGPGEPCPLPESTAAGHAPAPTSPSTSTSGDGTVQPVAPQPRLQPASPWPWVSAGVGTGALVAGAVVAFVGVQPWFAHAAARDALATAEKQGTTEGAAALYAEQGQARSDWATWGQASVAGGLALAVVGTVAAVGGATWGVTGGGAE